MHMYSLNWVQKVYNAKRLDRGFLNAFRLAMSLFSTYAF